jgi:hypothetical protein
MVVYFFSCFKLFFRATGDVYTGDWHEDTRTGWGKAYSANGYNPIK